MQSGAASRTSPLRCRPRRSRRESRLPFRPDGALRPALGSVCGVIERRSVCVDGNRISFVECGPADGPVVLLVHGLMSDSGTWTEDLEPLAAHGIRAIAIDLLGH